MAFVLTYILLEIITSLFDSGVKMSDGPPHTNYIETQKDMAISGNTFVPDIISSNMKS